MENIILVTGATDGIGKATALELARRGSRVILHGRNLEKAQHSKAEILLEVPGALLDTVIADLSSLEQVRTLADNIKTRFTKLDVLIHNAGIYMKQRLLSVDGFEMTLAVNHLAPFLLTCELLPLLRESHTRVITVSSMTHGNGRLDFSNLNAEKHFSSLGAYAQSKAANVLFSNELAERERGKLTSNSLHPGVIATKLLTAGFGMAGASPARGATTSVFLATSPDVNLVSGKYFSDSRETKPATHTLDQTTQKRLWEISMEWTKPTYG